MLGNAPRHQRRRDWKLSKARNIEQEKLRGIVAKDKPIGDSGGNARVSRGDFRRSTEALSTIATNLHACNNILQHVAMVNFIVLRTGGEFFKHNVSSQSKEPYLNLSHLFFLYIVAGN